MNTLHIAGAMLAVTTLATVAVGASLAAFGPEASEAYIPFAKQGGIRSWAADSDHGLWVQDVRSKWYYASFAQSCTGLESATAIVFDVRRPLNRFDRDSTVVVPGQARCAVGSLTLSEGPEGPREAGQIVSGFR